jgi:hypothetical protein
MISQLLEKFVDYINENRYSIFGINGTITEYMSNDSYINDFKVYFYRFIKEEKVPYEVYITINKEKFIELGLARNIEKYS